MDGSVTCVQSIEASGRSGHRHDAKIVTREAIRSGDGPRVAWWHGGAAPDAVPPLRRVGSWRKTVPSVQHGGATRNEVGAFVGTGWILGYGNRTSSRHTSYVPCRWRRLFT